ncbi:MAG: glycosyltransferase family 4 protein [Armatimonadota bacterium]
MGQAKPPIFSLPRTNPFLLAEQCDFTSAQLAAHREVMDAYTRLRSFRPDSMNWLLPHFEHILIGGVRTIASFADYYRQAKGVRSRLIIYNPQTDAATYHERLALAFPDFPPDDVIALPDGDYTRIPDADAVLATFWPSAYLALKFNRTRAKFYFMQDFEALFYASGTEAALADATYRFGLYGICNSPGVGDAYRAASGAPAVAFWPAVDTSVFHPLPPGQPKHASGEPKQVVFYGRPQRPRNAFALGMEVLARLKETLGDRVRIVSAGAEWRPEDYGMGDAIEVLGLLPTLESVADLYRHCDAGLIFMMTKHPSYQPLEYMACGCPTVSNHNPANNWLLRDGQNCLLCEPSITCVTDKLLAVLTDEALSSRLIQGGLMTVSATSWEGELERVWAFICKEIPT